MQEKLKKIFTWPDIFTDLLIVISTGAALVFGLNETQYAFWISVFMFIVAAMCIPYDIEQALKGKKDYYIYDDNRSE